MRYYNYYGEQITEEESRELHENAKRDGWNYRVITKTVLSVDSTDINYEISTIFIGIGLDDSENPFLFETMVFAGPSHSELSFYTDRYDSFVTALIGHRLVAEQIKQDMVRKLEWTTQSNSATAADPSTTMTN